MNFIEVKEKIRTFINEELISLEPWIVNSEWSEKLPKLNESAVARVNYNVSAFEKFRTIVS